LPLFTSPQLEISTSKTIGTQHQHLISQLDISAKYSLFISESLLRDKSKLKKYTWLESAPTVRDTVQLTTNTYHKDTL
jgi:hypothetical protein